MSPTGLDHVTLTARDFPRSVAFYDAVLGALGFGRLAELVDEEQDEPELEAVGWGVVDGAALVWLVPGTVPTTGLHVRFRAGSRVEVEAFHSAGVGLGAASHAAPRRWAIYRRGEYGAILADPDGNLVEAVADE